MERYTVAASGQRFVPSEVRVTHSFVNRGISLALLAAFASACVDPALEERVGKMESRLDAIEKGGVKVAAGAPGAGAAPGVDPEAEKAASELLRAASDAQSTGDFATAKAKVAELQAKYGGTRTAARAGKLSEELAIIGSDAGALTTEKWYTADKGDLTKGKATLLVFWEVWCPHCKREVPKLNEVGKAHPDLNIVALTKQTKNITDDQVNEFIKTNALDFPVGKEDGSMSAHFAVSGIPAAAVVKDGKVIWRGHPARLDDAAIDKLLGS